MYPFRYIIKVDISIHITRRGETSFALFRHSEEVLTFGRNIFRPFQAFRGGFNVWAKDISPLQTGFKPGSMNTHLNMDPGEPLVAEEHPVIAGREKDMSQPGT